MLVQVAGRDTVAETGRDLVGDTRSDRGESVAGDLVLSEVSQNKDLLGDGAGGMDISGGWRRRNGRWHKSGGEDGKDTAEREMREFRRWRSRCDGTGSNEHSRLTNLEASGGRLAGTRGE